ncbi:AMP-binding protein [Paucibacter sp. AS339]|uniref:phenylacetate--CoA ligase family protein n=1 Tax=Paucibacter hankyongi TaxID=3133434 RepID=UPI003095036F
MSAYTRLVSDLLFPLHERLKGHSTLTVRRGLEQSQWLSPLAIEEFQLRRLNEFLVEVAKNVPYYRELMANEGVVPGQFASLSELQRLPFLTKSVIRANTEGMKSAQAGSLARFNTGGSTGEPLIFFIGKERVSHDVAAKWRATRWWGVDIGDPEIVVWGSPIELGAQDHVRWLRDKVFRTELLPAFEMSAAKLDRFVEAIRKKRPKMLFGYPSALSHIARHARERGVVMHNLGIKVAFVTSERLYDEQRVLISEVFGCPVANGYGGRDAGFIAHECPAGGIHMTAEDVIVELVDEEGKPVPNGVAGEIVVTHLATKEFPFIRYRTGDVAVKSSCACACGRGLPLLQEIQGRTTDFVLTQHGEIMHGLALIYVLRDLPSVNSFKIVQHSRLFTEVFIVAADGFGENVRALIIKGFKRRLGEGVEVIIKIVDKIPVEKSGKFRYIISYAEGS